jgi:lipopolysaccharide biosynthesis glycosyltransferase
MKNLIVFTIDENYLEPFIVAIESFSHFHNVKKYDIALVHSDISEDNIEKIIRYVKSKNISIEIVRIEDTFEKISVGYHFNSVIFYRLLLPSIFNNYEKLLYLDSDILFAGNVDKLFNISLDNKILAAIPKHEYAGIPVYLQDKINTYFASGLLLINVKEFNKFKIYDKCLNFLKNEEYDMPDQDALNAVVDRWLELDLEFGVETFFLEMNSEKLNKIIKNPKIIQFSGSSKPWHFRNRHPYKKLYWKYLKMTPFKRYIPKDLTLFNLTKFLIPNSIKQLIKARIF